MIALSILLAHLVGDYLFQTNTMAQRKVSSWVWALIHAGLYTGAYALLNLAIMSSGFDGFSRWALIVIGGTHAVIDRYRLVKPLIWGLNNIPGLTSKGSRYSWEQAKGNGGYEPGMPVWMSTWLMIIVDNTIHLLINTFIIFLMWKGIAI